MQNKTKKPNVIFFFSDQQRWDTCGCYEGPNGSKEKYKDFIVPEDLEKAEVKIVPYTEEEYSE
jgi:arylsulfatase A-like enzyme